jgi:multimeric flavodoxin WrbA
MNRVITILGIAASLRNARWGIGNKKLIKHLGVLENEQELKKFLREESEIHLENFIQAGRAEGKDFLHIRRTLNQNRGDSGLSNSEVALASALWAAKNVGVRIDHCSLSEYFLPNGTSKNLDQLKEKLINADGFIVSGPVYFGDRGSLSQSFLELIQRDSEFQDAVSGKLYAGIAVGAKRNGGQETTLIYQMFDFLSLGMLGVGNDSDTTAQYGGTGLAGDVGTMHADDYGLATSIGTGRRIATLATKLGKRGRIKGQVKMVFLILQDSMGNHAERYTTSLLANIQGDIETTILNISKANILRCIACDICPTHIDVDDEYRCIISADRDDMSDLHVRLLDYDAIIPVIWSGIDGRQITSNYQKFIERTRYLRRGDYVWSDVLVSPIIWEEIGGNKNMALRVVTSMVRHHTILSRPIVGYIKDENILNEEEVIRGLSSFVDEARRVGAARLTSNSQDSTNNYVPVGYVLSVDKDQEDQLIGSRVKMVQVRNEKQLEERKARLISGRAVTE